MSPARLGALGLSLLLAAATPARANVPAAYLPCEGLGDGDACQFSGLGDGACVLDTLCADHEVAGCPDCDKCLLCGDPCRGLNPGDACTLSDGGDGTCKRRAGCTDDVRFSFDECNHCLPHENADCALHQGGVGHWERHEGVCPVGGVPDDDLCWECMPGAGQSVKAESGGCSVGLAADRAAYGVWGLVAVALAVGARRRRPRG
jgi:MYXO-CTERM domain-containing protein